MLVVVGGHSRNIGKTSVIAGIIAAVPEAGWTAVKITQFGHGICAAAGKACDCGTSPEHPFSITEETRASHTDTGRFFAAGAAKSYWVRTAQGNMAAALPSLERIFSSSANVIVESNSLLQFVRPDLYLAVTDFGKSDFKESARRFLDRADALVVVNAKATVPSWDRVAHSQWNSKRQFHVTAPAYTSDELAAFVRLRLSAAFGGQGRTERDAF